MRSRVRTTHPVKSRQGHRKLTGLAPLLSTLVFLFEAQPATAIVIRHDRDEADYRRLAETVPPIVVQVGGGMGTLISADWILTAGHVAEGIQMRGIKTLTTGDIEREVEAVYVHPRFGFPEDHRDIGLIKLASSSEFRLESSAELYAGTAEAGRQVLLVGDGYTGTGKTGPQKGERILRAAHNTVESAADGWVRFHFDAPPAGDDLEGISGPGDSGGPAFLVIDGTYQIIGVSAYNAGGPACTYGTDEYYCRVSDELPWIQSVLSGESGSNRGGSDSNPGESASNRGGSDSNPHESASNSGGSDSNPHESASNSSGHGDLAVPTLRRYGTNESGQQTLVREPVRTVPVTNQEQIELWRVVLSLTEALHSESQSKYLALFDPAYVRARKASGDPLENMHEFMQGVIEAKGKVETYHSVSEEGIQIPESEFPMRPVVFHLEDGTAGYYGLAINTQGKIDHFSLFVQNGICKEGRPCPVSKRVDVVTK